MSEATTDGSQRRVLLVADKGAEVDSLRTRLAAAGYAADSSDVESVIPFCTDGEFEPRAPSAVLLVFGGREGEGRLVALARRLRAEPSSFALPVLFLFREDSRSLRSSAQHFGAIIPRQSPRPNSAGAQTKRDGPLVRPPCSVF